MAWKSIGVWPGVSLKMARAKADKWNHDIFEGKDPFFVPEKVPTFQECVQMYLSDVLVVKQERQRGHWAYTLGPAYCAAILKKPVDKITVNDVRKSCHPLVGKMSHRTLRAQQD